MHGILSDERSKKKTMKNKKIIFSVSAFLLAIVFIAGIHEYASSRYMNAFEQGKEEGYEEGHDDGYREGYDEGKDIGNKEGYQDGYYEGYNDALIYEF